MRRTDGTVCHLICIGGVFLLFHTFSSQTERRDFGGSDFIEMQFCRMPEGTVIDKIVSADIEHWLDDSLYIYGDDENRLVSQYGEIFAGGIYNNLQCGELDLFGINYYSPEQYRLIVERIRSRKPLDYAVLLNWLEKGEALNGFYILGL